MNITEEHSSMNMGEEDHSQEHEESSNTSEEIRLETEFTPDSDLEEFTGTFADLSRFAKRRVSFIWSIKRW